MSLEAFQRQIDSEPWTTLLILADWLEEQGQGDLAEAYRWLVKERKYPHRADNWVPHTEEVPLWMWFPASNHNSQFNRMPLGVASTGIHRNLSAAYHNAAMEIVKARKAEKETEASLAKYDGVVFQAKR